MQVEKTLYKHSAGISAMAMHPTGKLCFTAGKVCDVNRIYIGWDPLIVAENLQCFCEKSDIVTLAMGVTTFFSLLSTTSLLAAPSSLTVSFSCVVALRSLILTPSNMAGSVKGLLLGY